MIEQREGAAATADVPGAVADDLVRAEAVVVGTPTRFADGNPCGTSHHDALGTAAVDDTVRAAA